MDLQLPFDVNPFDRLADLVRGVPVPDGVTPLRMCLGEPQLPPPELIATTLQANERAWNRYPPTSGELAYRQACVRWLNRRYRLPSDYLDPDRHILSLSGTKEGLFLIAQVAVGPERRSPARVVLIPSPYYLVYDGAARMAGAETVYLRTSEASGHLPDLDGIDASILRRTALAYLCSPSNPQGAVASLEYLEKYIQLARTFDFILVVDECYSEIYDEAPPPGALEACVRLGEGLRNVLIFNSLSKRSNAGGLRCGFVAGDERIIEAFRRLRSFSGGQVPIPIQLAGAALWDDDEHVEINRRHYRCNFEIAAAVLGDAFELRRPAASFFLWLNVGDGEAAALKLWRKAGIRVLPGAYLTPSTPDDPDPAASHIRVALVHDPATVEMGLRALRRLL
ncbi:MAG: aminotransferase class I/II-fold pyridoxal phosphate-dependent enzyme [Phenylobacterium sp.]|uniref:aminotransferase class I/II-fold pyridoxal phosphate-dependent enzyme n=1 Tax=Phenylobacterium sp. TaxID=1871053 RepID=UPI0027353DB4|nr:aminotransferase class I/II-fold pyridoxal phosphate-dependent enzyme [Phenylobacterium sp.]MDP3745632.1 aminotransferase class I/II-fold pyridoxal phosphate-dependent enzyme [Phenylobacterium sp.]